MPIPVGNTVFSWTQKQAYDLQQAASKLKIFYEEWASLTSAQKTGLKNRANSVIDTVISELDDIKVAVSGL